MPPLPYLCTYINISLAFTFFIYVTIVRNIRMNYLLELQ